LFFFFKQFDFDSDLELDPDQDLDFDPRPALPEKSDPDSNFLFLDPTHCDLVNQMKL